LTRSLRIRRAATAALLTGVLSSCSTETTLTIRAQGENAEGETVPLSNVTLEIIPYDIDQVYEELEADSLPGPAPQADTLRVQRVDTDQDGMASLTVPNGTWWILGTAPVPGSISQRYRWNERIEAVGGEQTVELTSENARLEPLF
jgi:hypothetical protein